MGPESWGRRESGRESWDQRVGTRSCPERWDQQLGPESGDRRVRTGELGLEWWNQRHGVGTRGCDGSPPEAGRESAGHGTRQLGPESWGWRLGTRSWDKTVGRVRRVGTRSWDQRVARVGTRELGPEKVGTGELGPESWDQELGRESAGDGTRQLGPESWGRRLGTRSWDKTVGRVGTRELGELGLGVGTRELRELGPES